MRMLTVLFLLLLISPAYGQLTKEDLRTIIKEEVRPIIKEEIAASEKRTREYIDLKVETINARIDALDQRIDDVENNLNTRIDDVENNLSDKIGALDNSLNARIDDIRIMMIALIGLIAAAIALPQIIIAYKDRGRKEMQTQQQEMRVQHQEMQAQIDELRKELSVGPSPHHPDKI